MIDDEAPTPGIVTERDLLLSIGAGEDPDAEPVAGHMTESVITAAPDWSLEHAAAEMSRRGVRHLVVFEGGEVVGILSMRDIVRVWTSEGATSEFAPPPRAGLRAGRRFCGAGCAEGLASSWICSIGSVALRASWRRGRAK